MFGTLFRNGVEEGKDIVIDVIDSVREIGMRGGISVGVVFG